MWPEWLARFLVSFLYSWAGAEKARQEVLRKEAILQANAEADADERAKFGVTSGIGKQ